MREAPRALVRALVDVAAGVGDKLMPLTKKVKWTRSPSLFISRGEIGELLPALELGAVVERHDDELRRPLDAGLRRRRRASAISPANAGNVDRAVKSAPRPRVTAMSVILAESDDEGMGGG